MKVFRQPAYVLHTRPYSETSLLVDVFSRDHGRCMLLAKGARRQKNAQRGILLPFKPLLTGWSGKGALPVLTSVEATGHLPELRGNALHAGWYANELVLRMLHRFDEHASLFDAYDAAVRALAAGADAAESLRLFEKHLLQETGFGLILDHDVETGEAIIPDTDYRYRLESGPVMSSSVTAANGGVRVRGSTLREMDAGEFRSLRSRQEARRLNRDLIRVQLGHRELRSRKVLQQILRYRNGPGGGSD